MAAKLKTGDKVVVLTGKDKGKEGEIVSVDPKAGKAVVDGINMAIRHTRQSQTNQGGRLPKAMPIDLSNLAIVDKNGNPVIDPSSFALNQSTWDAASVGGASPADGLFFNGSFAVAANSGQPLGLYSPNPWEGGSSSAHLDDQNPALAGLMMLAATDTGPGARTLSAVEIGVLRDIGYTVAAVPEPESYAMMLAGLAMLGAIAKRRTR